MGGHTTVSSLAVPGYFHPQPAPPACLSSFWRLSLCSAGFNTELWGWGQGGGTRNRHHPVLGILHTTDASRDTCSLLLMGRHPVSVSCPGPISRIPCPVLSITALQPSRMRFFSPNDHVGPSFMCCFLEQGRSCGQIWDIQSLS